MTRFQSRAPRGGARAVFLATLAAALVLSSGRPADGRELGGERSSRPAAPVDLLSHALGQLLYDARDDDAGASSALRGHSLARSLYGANDQTLNIGAFNGTGRLHFEHPAGAIAPVAVDDHRLVNYQRFDGDPLRDPERYGTRADAAAPRPYFTGGFNASYTYPDANNMFLAAVRSDGSLLTPSFHRSWIFGPLDAFNPHWWTPEGKYLLLRPRPAEMAAGFPSPEELGDVKQLDGAPGGNDSIWMDLGYPVQTRRDGRKWKPLFAFLIVDLDSRIRVTKLGKRLDVGPGASAQGWGPWEVALAHVSTPESVSVDRLEGLPRPALAPWLWDRAAESSYGVAADDPTAPPSGPAVRFPSFDRRGHPLGDPGLAVPAFSDLRTPGRAPGDPETDWRGFRSLDLVAQGSSAPEDPVERDHALEAVLQGRVDLDRHLTPYPDRPHATGREASAEALRAQTERQRFAEEIYRNLLLVTGVAPVPADRRAEPRAEDLAPRRWLAQLAVNVVDYVDEDEVATAFHFYSSRDGLAPGDVGQGRSTARGELIPRYWVFGTELPRVVLNEVMAEVEEGEDGSGDRPATVRVWAELLAPSHDVPSPDPESRPGPAGPVPLFADGGSSGGYGIFEVVLADAVEAADAAPLDVGEDVLGSPHVVRGVADFLPTLGTLGSPDRPAPARIGADRFLLVGPVSQGGQDARRTLVATRTRPASTLWHRSEGMEFPLGPGDGPRPRVTVLLRRLANPHLPPDPRPSANGTLNPAYNPYVTVDYVEDVLPSDPAVEETRASGKLQPYASHPDRVRAQTVDQGGGAHHTLGEPNAPREAPDWLVHLDRALLSPVELLQVSGYRPHLLTHRFITTPAGEAPDYAHRAPWLDEDLAGAGASRERPSHRLYRLFEYLRAGSDAARRQGVVNLNTIYDRDAFGALLPSTSRGALDDDGIEALWLRFLELRSPGLLDPVPSLTALDRPFVSPGVGHLPSTDPQANGRGVGIDDTIFRAREATSSGGIGQLFDRPDATHPYVRKELLAELYDRVATRSNVFAVWLTVGFFEVVDEQTRPPRLGPEIGATSGAARRLRFFAIVDRSQMHLFGSNEQDGIVQTTPYLTRSDLRSGLVPHPGSHWVRLESVSGRTATELRDASGAPTGELLPWKIVPGSHLFVDEGRDREMVLVTDVDPVGNAIQAAFGRRHEPGFAVTMPGNPGPQPAFDLRAPRYRDVVRFAVSLR